MTSLGESNKYLKTTVVSKVISILLIFAASFVDIYYMVGAGCIAAIISVIITGRWNRSLIDYSFLTFLKDIIPSMLVGGISACLVYYITLLDLNSFAMLVVGGGGGVIFYLSMAYVFKFKQIQLVLNILKHE